MDNQTEPKSEELLRNALAHEFERCRESFALFTFYFGLIIKGNRDTKIALSSYNAYVDFISQLYEFYLGCIKRKPNFPSNASGKVVDSIINAEVRKLLNIRKDRISRGDAGSNEDNISVYEIVVPEEFGYMFRTVRNLRSHAIAKRSEFDLADFYHKYHRFIYLLFVEPQWLWNMELFPEHNWHEIEKFSKALLSSKKVNGE